MHTSKTAASNPQPTSTASTGAGSNDDGPITIAVGDADDAFPVDFFDQYAAKATQPTSTASTGAGSNDDGPITIAVGDADDAFPVDFFDQYAAKATQPTSTASTGAGSNDDSPITIALGDADDAFPVDFFDQYAAKGTASSSSKTSTARTVVDLTEDDALDIVAESRQHAGGGFVAESSPAGGFMTENAEIPEELAQELAELNALDDGGTTTDEDGATTDEDEDKDYGGGSDVVDLTMQGRLAQFEASVAAPARPPVAKGPGAVTRGGFLYYGASGGNSIADEMAERAALSDSSSTTADDVMSEVGASASDSESADNDGSGDDEAELPADGGGLAAAADGDFASDLSKWDDHGVELVDLLVSASVRKALGAGGETAPSAAARALQAETISEELVFECASLLDVMGIPYIQAPFEAEAQCAVLLELGLVDGIITDDSDVFLFGGDRVYRSFFDERRYVRRFDMSVMKDELGLDRDALVFLAHLLGSDYTAGVHGVGAVTAMEVLAAWPPSEYGGGREGVVQALEAFKAYVTALPHEADALIAGRPERLRVRAAVKRLQSTVQLPARFPDTAVVEAYLAPAATRDDEPFEWEEPRFDALEQFAVQTFRWSAEKAATEVAPVRASYAELVPAKVQTKIDAFYLGAGAGGLEHITRIGSRRLRGVVAQLLGVKLSSLPAPPEEEARATARKRKRKRGAEPAPAEANAPLPAVADVDMLRIHDALHNYAVRRVVVQGEAREVQVFPNSGCRFVAVGPYTFIEQNKAKDSYYAAKARDGALISWIPTKDGSQWGCIYNSVIKHPLPPLSAVDPSGMHSSEEWTPHMLATLEATLASVERGQARASPARPAKRAKPS
ncbi:uncharacterized protein AMSG_03182 [Thecamonas trahens ATCC 50062]|uniref:XPG-I domain-containing protein n=1 Tax=Thecamonas trahens ATCC 50062 TaxID=461836 RepID=A0A0L0D614_THETB|nr:hypothetical protein AMSG_03182 [Thecamonas trahens ATCC 50062]KNC46753.1 hypothetical protein AMSG_03182 [Thecamonas trahens ATCC 50062]|eukprot:XP_013760033.1 hypothetical protein AMSG_03182 [Thecamonas trahens ATCC 50062]